MRACVVGVRLEAPNTIHCSLGEHSCRSQPHALAVRVGSFLCRLHQRSGRVIHSRWNRIEQNEQSECSLPKHQGVSNSSASTSHEIWLKCRFRVCVLGVEGSAFRRAPRSSQCSTSMNHTEQPRSGEQGSWTLSRYVPSVCFQQLILSGAWNSGSRLRRPARARA